MRRFNREVITVGRAKDRDIVLEGDRISRWHARIHVEDESLSFEDISDSGSEIEGRHGHGRRELAPGTEVQLGGHTLTVQRDTPLVQVEDAFPAGKDLVLHPRVILEAGAPQEPLHVELELPDGILREARVRFDVAHMRNARGTFALVRVLDTHELPPGTRVWRTDG